jgi:phosphatidylglycerol:prolipoprotein diacylglycerol transferase
MLTLATWLHDLDPVAFEVLGFPVRWYGLSYLAGFLIGYLLVRRVASRGRSPLSPQQAGDLVITLALSVVVGGRLGYVLFYDPSLLADFSSQPPWWGLLRINDGGMASHGGMLGGIVGCLHFAYRHAQPKLFLGDLMAFGAPFGLGLGRVANFINGELVGRVCDPGFSLAVKFPTAMRIWPAEKVRMLMRAYRAQAQGSAPGLKLLEERPRAFVDYIIAEIQDGSAELTALVRPMLAPRHPSQLYAALGEGVRVVLLWFFRKPRKPGSVGFLFLVVYGLVRIVDELWRKPDAHIGFDWLFGLAITRGQWLSLAMVLAGAIGLMVVYRRTAESLGGWLRGGLSASDLGEAPLDAANSETEAR